MSKYPIAFDINQECLKQHYHADSPNNAYYNIAPVLKKHGFNKIQGSVHISTREDISEGHDTLALQEVATVYDGFAECVSNIKFDRLEADLGAQFIVEAWKTPAPPYIQPMQPLRRSLLQAGLPEDKLNKILSQQNLAVGNIILP